MQPESPLRGRLRARLSPSLIFVRSTSNSGHGVEPTAVMTPSTNGRAAAIARCAGCPIVWLWRTSVGGLKALFLRLTELLMRCLKGRSSTGAPLQLLISSDESCSVEKDHTGQVTWRASSSRRARHLFVLRTALLAGGRTVAAGVSPEVDENDFPRKALAVSGGELSH
jgi:hypothetical protein